MAEVVRPGRSVELVEGALHAGDVEILRARAWRIRTKPLDLSPPPAAPEPPPGPEAGQPRPFFDTGHDTGYHTAMESRFVVGAYLEPGPAKTWMRMRVPLVEGEEPSPLDRVLVAADSGNGVSAPLDWRRFLFINADLSVALRRLPEGEWVLLDAVSHTEPDGVGLTDTLLSDERGPIGRGTQSLLIGEQG